MLINFILHKNHININNINKINNGNIKAPQPPYYFILKDKSIKSRVT